MTLTTNTNGNAGMYIYPYHSYNTTASAYPFASTYNSTTFDPLVGNGGVSTAYDGPFAPNVSSMR